VNAVGAGDVRHVPLPVDPARYTVQDGAGTVRSAIPRWRHLLEDVEELPHATTVALGAVADALAAAGGLGETIGELVAPVNAALLEVADRAGATTPLLDALDPSDPLVTAVESVDRFLSAAARAVAVDLVAPDAGEVAAINVSRGGVPKSAVAEAEIGPAGVVGDGQKVRRHHGRPSQALCLWSLEVVEALAGEGHPIVPGGAGENLTLAGLDWAALRPGVRLVLGDGPDAPVAEITGWTEPCTTIADCFSDRGFRRIDHSLRPGWSRAYAAVVRGGPVRAGARVTVLP
jgi:MOSC domain-containing protein YiiM